MSRFDAIHVSNFEELQRQVSIISEGKQSYAFRGYTAAASAGASTGIRPAAFTTGIERICLAIDRDLRMALSREAAIVREFMRRAHHHLSDVPTPRGLASEPDRLEWLALMQHHGAPTRLLDWTYSLYVATHFACLHGVRDTASDLAIWLINTEWCLRSSAAICEAAGHPAAGITRRPIRIDDYPTAFDGLLSG
jgi:hypothetical protein